MKKKSNNNKKTKIILLILVLCVTLGYAALRTGLNINGIATIPSVSWDVYFANYQNSASTNIDPTTEPSTPAGTKPTTVSYAVTLANPGDLYEFTIDIVNDGTIDANINLVSKLDDVEISSENPIPDYLTYKITDTSDVDIPENHRLNKNTTETIKVKLLFKENIDPEDLPSGGASLKLDIELTATQAEKETSRIVYTTNLYDGNYDTIRDKTNTSVVWLERAITSNITAYDTPEEAMSAFSNNPYYLKHVLNGNNEVEESYVGLVISDALKAEWKSQCDEYDEDCEDRIESFVNGTYYLRGGVDESSLVEKPIFEANKNTLKGAFNYDTYPNVCENGDNIYFDCLDHFTYVTSAGGIDIMGSTSACGILAYDKCSFCSVY